MEDPAPAGVASVVAAKLQQEGFAPYFGTPCGVLAPLYRELVERAGLTTITREDNAVGIAAGCALAGRQPVVLMQNSGLGQSVNAFASLVVPYHLPILAIVSLRGTAGDPTSENLVMGRLTSIIFSNAGIPSRTLAQDSFGDAIEWARHCAVIERRPVALTVPPRLFGWRP